MTCFCISEYKIASHLAIQRGRSKAMSISIAPATG